MGELRQLVLNGIYMWAWDSEFFSKKIEPQGLKIDEFESYKLIAC